MNKADELERLSRLRDEGVLNDDEFQQQKQAILAGKRKKSFAKSWWFRVPLLALGLVLLADLMITLGNNSLPACDSSNVKETLQKAFDNAQFARQMSLSVVDIRDAVNVSGPSDKPLSCKATVVLNNTEELSVQYELEGKDNGQYMLEFEVVDR